MVLRIDDATGGRLGAPLAFGLGRDGEGSANPFGPGRWSWRRVGRAVWAVLAWAHRGYRQANAGDLASAIAFNALVALVPTFLLCLAVAGLFLQIDRVLNTALYTSFWGLPRDSAGDAFAAILSARGNTSWLGALGLVGFAWSGAGFVSCLARSMNRVYGVPGCGYMCERRRGFFVILAFAALFVLAMLSATVPTLFVGRDLPFYLEEWALAAGSVQLLGYALAILATVALFGMLYRVVPNAGQHLGDVWPGTVTAAALFVAIAQAFPLYVRLVGGANRYGAVFGFVSLLVVWLYALAHVLLFGTYVNVTFQRWRRQRGKRPSPPQPPLPLPPSTTIGKEEPVSTRIDRRDDVNPKEGLREHGDVEFADPTNHKYPIDTPEHVRAAWSYINHRDNAGKYDKDEVKAIKDRIKRAAKKHGVEISAE